MIAIIAILVALLLAAVPQAGFTATILGYDGPLVRTKVEDLAEGKSLFSPYQTIVDLPEADSVQDFIVP